MKRKISILLIVVMIISMMTACSPSNSKNDVENSSLEESDKKDVDSNAEKKEKVLIVAAKSEPLHFNVNATNAGSDYAARNIFSALFKITLSGDLIPDLCKDYTISEDGLTYTFNLYDNVKWHDGEQFSSEDVKFTVEAIIENKGSSVKRLSCIDEIECPDNKTLIFKLSKKDAALLSSMSSVRILPKHLYEGKDWLDNPANQNPIGTGPFKFVEHKKGTNVTLVAFDDYFLGRAKVDKIVYKTIPDVNTIVQAYLNNEVDVMDLAGAISPEAMPTLENDSNTKISTLISYERQCLITNLSKEPWSNLKVRQAVALALDRDEMVTKAHKGYSEKAEGFYTPAVSWAYTDKYKMPDRDIEKAKQLLDEAGFTADADGIRIKDAEISIFKFAVFSDLAKIIQANLREIGIECKITTLEYAAWAEKMKRGEFDISILGGPYGPDPDLMASRIEGTGYVNYMKYQNDRIDELLSLGRESSQSERPAIYYEIQKILSEELPLMPLTEWCYIVVTRDNIKGHYAELKDTVGAGTYYNVDIE